MPEFDLMADQLHVEAEGKQRERKYKIIRRKGYLKNVEPAMPSLPRNDGKIGMPLQDSRLAKL